MTEWIPFGMSEDLDNVLVDGIPSYMRESLLDWLNSAEVLLCGGYMLPERPEAGRRRQLINRFDRRMHRISKLSGNSIYDASSGTYELEYVYLQYTDFLIHEICEMVNAPFDPSAFMAKDPNKIKACLNELEEILSESGSKWKVGMRNGYAGLEERVEPTMQDMADAVMSDSNKASQYLSKAWHELFGQEPNYSLAYATAIKAVEAVAIPEVSPRDLGCTLGKAAQVMREQGWSFEIEPNPKGKVEGGIAQVMMNAMMFSHSDRHPSNSPEKDETITKRHAEAAVYSAVFLVQSFKSGLVLSPDMKQDRKR